MSSFEDPAPGIVPVPEKQDYTASESDGDRAMTLNSPGRPLRLPIGDRRGRRPFSERGPGLRLTVAPRGAAKFVATSARRLLPSTPPFRLRKVVLANSGRNSFAP